MTESIDADALRPLAVFLPDWTARRIAANARAGRLVGAVKVGGSWMIRRSDFERWISGGAALHRLSEADR